MTLNETTESPLKLETHFTTGVWVVVAFMAVALYHAFLTGMVGWQLYQWFIVPLNVGAPAVTGWQIAGIALLIGALRHNFSRFAARFSEDDTFNRMWHETGHAFQGRPAPEPDMQQINQAFISLFRTFGLPIVSVLMQLTVGWMVAKLAGMI